MAQTKQKFTAYKHVALIIGTSNHYDQGLLKGIKQYMQENHHWSIYMSDVHTGDSDLSWLSHWKGDGIIARVEYEQIAEYIAELNLPTIDLSSARLLSESPHVVSKDYLTAQMAADHLLKKGIRHFAFCRDSNRDRSESLDTHIHTYLHGLGHYCHRFAPAYAVKSKIETRIQMARWLESLPKPIGIFSSSSGEDVLEACQLAGVAVPDEAAVVGFDNRDILCELLDRQLATVILNTVKAGYNAAVLLDQMIMEKEIIKDAKEELSHHQSVQSVARKDKLISDALNFIHRNACDGITVNDVLSKVPLSRRMLEHRFRQMLGRTPHEEIVAARLKSVKKLLAETNLPLVSIADLTGFKHTEYLSVVFKREVGISPGQYRKLRARKRISAVNY